MRFDNGAGIGIVAALGVMLTSYAALAGDYGCRSAECYERVRQPDVYGTVTRPVVVHPGHTEVLYYPPAIVDRLQAVEVVPGSFNVQRQPAMYGSYTRTVMVSPARFVQHHAPSVRKVVHTREVVRPAQVRWEYQRDAHGRMTKCKVVTPAVTRTVARTVVVAPAHIVEHVIPARFAQVQQPMLVEPARTHYTYTPPVYQYVSEPMMIRPATREVINHPPVIGFEQRDVLLRRGGYAWAPVGHSSGRRHW